MVYKLSGIQINTYCFYYIIYLHIILGPSLYGLSYAGALPGGDKISFIHCMLFASIIVAVDPVAVSATQGHVVARQERL